MTTSSATPIRWTEDGKGLIILDQTRLPEEMVELKLHTVQDIFDAIAKLRVRGAPLIGITAAMGVAALARQDAMAESKILRYDVGRWCDYFATARSTAVNLSWALARMRDITRENEEDDTATLVAELGAEAQAIWDEDADMCANIGEHAVDLIPDGGRVLTHCNAGALATGGIGTALAPVYLAHQRGNGMEIFVGETRPLLQGSRLTAWELKQAGMDVRVITDNMAGAFFQRTRPDVVLVGADRIAANGDVANKIGTYGLAVLARYHGVPFYVLAPTSTIDLDAGSGDEIPIEHRAEDEVRRGFGRLTSPEDVPIWSPAFDVTPAEFITGIVTEYGVIEAPFAEALETAVDSADNAIATAATDEGEGESIESEMDTAEVAEEE
jgi:methylthioribose-1-phosphate isomerase